MDKNYQLYGSFAARYDLHTPPRQYQADQDFVLEEIRRSVSGSRILDLGCGTGALVKRARDAGLDAFGIDASPEMVAMARRQLSPSFLRVQRLQDLADHEAYDALVSLSFPFNYCSGVSEARQALERFHHALRPGGLLLLQVAHAANAPPRLMEDWEAGPGGERDIQFLSHFTAVPSSEAPVLRAQYVYSCRSLKELFFEEHELHVADVYRVAELCRETGFAEVQIYNDGSRAPLTSAMAPYVRGIRRA